MRSNEGKEDKRVYRESALYWLRKMGTDVKKNDWESLRLHYKDFGEAFSLAKIARKKGD